MDNKNKTAPQDASRVNVNEDYELRYWTKRFNVSEEELRNAVAAVGTSVKSLEDYFNKR